MASLILAGCHKDLSHAGTPLDRSRFAPVFDEEFDHPPSFWDSKTAPAGRWKTNYFSGQQDPHQPDGWQSRTLAPNGELQYYGDPARNPTALSWKNGVLDIIGQDNPASADPTTNYLPFLSGLITTEKSFAQSTGYFEARIALPLGKGLWPAFWLLPIPKTAGNGLLQDSGTQEIDVFESVGERDRLYFSLYPDDPQQRKIADERMVKTNIDLTAFHTYGVLVTPVDVIWYIDDKEVRRLPNKDFHRPAYMLLNLAIGGHWPGKPDNTTVLPAHMRIDWVRAWKLK